jgi:hypothetical protein
MCFPILGNPVSLRSVIIFSYMLMVSRVAQSVQCLTTDWTTGRSGFDPRQRRKDFSSSLCVQTGSEAHPTSYTLRTGGPFHGGVKRGRGVTLTTHPHLVPRSRMSRSYTSSPPSAFMACSGTALALSATRSSKFCLPVRFLYKNVVCLSLDMHTTRPICCTNFDFID